MTRRYFQSKSPISHECNDCLPFETIQYARMRRKQPNKKNFKSGSGEKKKKNKKKKANTVLSDDDSYQPKSIVEKVKKKAALFITSGTDDSANADYSSDIDEHKKVPKKLIKKNPEQFLKVKLPKVSITCVTKKKILIKAPVPSPTKGLIKKKPTKIKLKKTLNRDYQCSMPKSLELLSEHSLEKVYKEISDEGVGADNNKKKFQKLRTKEKVFLNRKIVKENSLEKIDEILPEENPVDVLECKDNSKLKIRKVNVKKAIKRLVVVDDDDDGGDDCAAKLLMNKGEQLKLPNQLPNRLQIKYTDDGEYAIELDDNKNVCFEMNSPKVKICIPFLDLWNLVTQYGTKTIKSMSKRRKELPVSPLPNNIEQMYLTSKKFQAQMKFDDMKMLNNSSTIDCGKQNGNNVFVDVKITENKLVPGDLVDKKSLVPNIDWKTNIKSSKTLTAKTVDFEKFNQLTTEAESKRDPFYKFRPTIDPSATLLGASSMPVKPYQLRVDISPKISHPNVVWKQFPNKELENGAIGNNETEQNIHSNELRSNVIDWGKKVDERQKSSSNINNFGWSNMPQSSSVPVDYHQKLQIPTNLYKMKLFDPNYIKLPKVKRK